MRTVDEIKQAPRVSNFEEYQFIDDSYSLLYRFSTGNIASVLISQNEMDNDGASLEHASVSMVKKKLLPTWGEMCELKSLVWRPDEECYQIHPKESEYIHGVGMPWDKLNNVLHIWRRKDEPINTKR